MEAPMPEVSCADSNHPGDLGTGQESNADAPVRISVVTFGAPSTMVVEPPDSTAAPLTWLTKLFHHIINRGDIVPFIVNRGAQTAKNIIKNVSHQLDITDWPEANLLFGAVINLFEAWAESRRPFAQYGRVYLIDRAEKASGGIFWCKPVIKSSQLPQTPPAELSLHAMKHYHYCLNNTLTAADRNGIPRMDLSTGVAMTLEQFYQDLLPLPNTIEDCLGTQSLNDVTVSCNITAHMPLIHLFIKDITFEVDIRWQQLRIYESRLEVSQDIFFADQPTCSLEIIYDILSDAPTEAVLSMINSIESSGLHLRDLFGRAFRIRVSTMRRCQLSPVCFQDTYGSIRNAMIIGFADQVATIRHLVAESGGDGNIQGLIESGPIGEHASTVAGVVDSLVANATPALIKRNFMRASKIVEDIWNPSREKQEEYPSDLQTHLDRLIQSFYDKKRGIYMFAMPILERLGLKSQDKGWEDTETFAKALADFNDVSLTETFRRYGQQLYHRDANSNNRMEIASAESKKVLLAMRFCHAIILTQLEPPMKFCLTLEPATHGIRGAIVTGIFYTARSWAMSAGWTYLSVFFGMYTGVLTLGLTAFAIQYMTTGTPQIRVLRQQGFDEILKTSLRILKPKVSGISSPEAAITDLLDNDDSRSDILEIQEKWRERLNERLRNSKIEGSRPVATLAWAKWLFDVGKVGRLRRIAVGQFYVGVEGATGAGKSTLLTALTAAPQGIFNPGVTRRFRTSEIQTYAPSGAETVFCDCPGLDDSNAGIREMARLFRGLMNIVIFVIPHTNINSQGTSSIFQEVANFIKTNNETKHPRPFRILMSRADEVDYEVTLECLRNNLIELKKSAIQDLHQHLSCKPELDAHGEPSINQSRNQTEPINFEIKTILKFNDTVIQSRESLRDVVHLYSTHLQMSSTGVRALSACPPGTRCKIGDARKYRHLTRLARENLLWDIESLRDWLRSLSPDIIPSSGGRVS
ncbi:hypothetical protein TWF481_011045 [Arthrobotrys musiformis]|uniref:G domain-containing protein n=1 Tax=Arthrobotrys musiformis TaxID=47236 RepID=A0AAV9VZ99_9PEZI